MAIRYKSEFQVRRDGSVLAIHHAPDGLQNPRETKAFVTKSSAGKWSITTVQIGNNFAHTVRDWSAVRTRIATLNKLIARAPRTN